MRGVSSISRSSYSPLAALILLNFIVRMQGWYTMPSYVTGDTTLLVWMAESILYNGKAIWLLHPMSITGFAEYSYPAGVPLLLAMTSAVTGLTRLDLLLPMAIIYIIFAVFAGYSLGMAFSGNRTIALFTAFAISLSSEFVGYTTASGSSSGRILLIIFLSLVIYLFFKLEKTGNIRYVPVILALTSVALITHRVSPSILVVFFAYGLAKIATLGFLRISKDGQRFARKNFKFIYVVLFFMFFAFTFSPWYPLQKHLQLLQKGLFFSGTSPICMTLNMIVDYAAVINPIVVLFCVVGVLRVLKSEKIDVNNLFLLFMLLGFAPVLAFSSYASQAITPIVALFFGCGLYGLVIRSEYISRWRSPVLSVVFVLAVVALLVYVTPLKSALFYNQLLNKYSPHVAETSKYIEAEDLEDIWAETRFIARDYMLYSGMPIHPLEASSYPVFYSKEFESVSFKFSFSPALLGYGNNIWSLNKKMEFDMKSKYKMIRQKKPVGFVGIIYDNGFERIIRETS
ncbi:MAG TPA: hypothetical protein PLY09_00570 [Methanothrix sp.]|nr:hypothetical protein [Methanothrix sp.]HPJ83236.1 hypothetical protein [Methanothrix sp.]